MEMNIPASNGERNNALLILQKARLDQLKKTPVQSKKSYQTFTDRIFNGKNSHHQNPSTLPPHLLQPKPPLLPSYTFPSDYNFKPQQPDDSTTNKAQNPVVFTTNKPASPVPNDVPVARSFSVYRPSEFSEAQATKKRDLKYQDYYDFISNTPPTPSLFNTPHHEPLHQVEEYEEPPRREREIHFSGFENDSLLSQVGKTVNARVPKAIRPGSSAGYGYSSGSKPGSNSGYSSGSKPGSIPGSGVPNINEPLFYPEKPLSGPQHHNPRERDFLKNQAVTDVQLTPGPVLGTRVTPSPHHSYQVTQPYQPSPLPHPTSGPPRPHRPTPDPYLAKPLAFSSPDFASFHSPSPPSSPYAYSPSPYLEHRVQSQERRYVSPTPSPLYYDLPLGHTLSFMCRHRQIPF